MRGSTRASLAGLLLALHAVLLAVPLRRTYITVDEVMNVAAGVSYWKTGRFFVYRVNPPMTKLLAVLPVLAAKPRIDLESLSDEPTLRAEFALGLQFTNLNRERIFDLVCLARWLGLVSSLFGGWLMYRWAQTLYGGDSGLLALALWVFEPYVLGHAALVMADIPAAVAGLAASYAFWRFLKAPSWGRAALAGVALGVAELTKFTLLVFMALWPAVFLVGRRFFRVEGVRAPTASAAVGQLILIFVISLYVINLGYLGLGTGTPLGEFPFVSHALTGQSDDSPAKATQPANRFRGFWLGLLPVPLPADYVRGIDVQRVDFEHTRLSYLSGTWRDHGWVYFYVYALAVKLPLSSLALMVWGVMLVRRPGAIRARAETLLLLTTAGAIVALVSSQTGYTQHSRYVIPALPYLMIVAGQLVGDGGHGRIVRRVAWGLVLMTAVSSLRVYPHSLSYFNEAAGGPDGGHRHLVDSNIDWGQDLLYLRAWLDAHPEARPLKLAYYNFMVDPSLAGIEFTLPPPGPEAARLSGTIDPSIIGPAPGYFAVSVNFLRGAIFPLADGRGEFRDARPHEFEYFLEFQPVAKAGYSIYIYHITSEQAKAARRRHGLLPIAPG